MKPRKTYWIVGLLIWLATLQTGLCFYNPQQGRWLSRDPIGEEAFLSFYSQDKSVARQLQLRSEALKPVYAFTANNPSSSWDAVGLCPAGKCDKWEITVVTITSGGIAVALLWVKAELRADPSCCMGGPLEYNRDYVYAGVGIGIGLKISLSINVGSKKFTTPCIGWNDHNGWGRVTAGGIGAVYTYGTIFLTTPQAYLNITSPSWGIDASDVTTVGRWRIQANSYQQQ